MATFITGLVILLLGGYLYGKFVEHVFKPDDRETPAVRMKDGIDYVPMNKWKNALINLLNIAGTGPIFGPIQGILFGPIAFITIPIGCVISGATHDYLSGMMSLRQNGAQMPGIIRKFLGNKTYQVYNIFLCFLMLLVGAVFTYTPGDLFAGQICGFQDVNVWTWVIYGGSCFTIWWPRCSRLIRSSERFIRFSVRFCFYQQSEYLQESLFRGISLTILILATASKEFLMYIQFSMHKEIQEWEQNSSLSFS